MSYIPKKAQRKIASANAPRLNTTLALAAAVVAREAMALPRYLSIHTNEISYCQKFDVFFKVNGGTEFIRQTACTVADVDKAYIERYKYARGRVGTSSETETLRGEVRIVWKGNAPE